MEDASSEVEKPLSLTFEKTLAFNYTAGLDFNCSVPITLLTNSPERQIIY
jgi:hypothetical protein